MAEEERNMELAAEAAWKMAGGECDTAPEGEEQWRDQEEEVQEQEQEEEHENEEQEEDLEKWWKGHMSVILEKRGRGDGKWPPPVHQV